MRKVCKVNAGREGGWQLPVQRFSQFLSSFCNLLNTHLITMSQRRRTQENANEDVDLEEGNAVHENNGPRMS